MEGWAAAGSQPILCCPSTPSPGQCGSPCHPGLGVLGGGAQPGGPHAPSPTLSSLSAHPHPGCKQQMTRSTAMLETGSVIACSRF